MASYEINVRDPRNIVTMGDFHIASKPRVCSLRYTGSKQVVKLGHCCYLPTRVSDSPGKTDRVDGDRWAYRGLIHRRLDACASSHGQQRDRIRYNTVYIPN